MEVNALFIVEGGKRERQLVNALIAKMIEDSNIRVHPFSVNGNIHMLYNKIKEIGGFSNIRDVLLSLKSVSEEDRKLLESDIHFAYTYLIFDYDPQYYDLTSADKIRRGLDDIREMIIYFNDETDDSIGKLYINYPMVESWCDHNWCLDDYLKRTVTLKDCVHYKNIVHKRGTHKNLSKYTKEDMRNLSDLNLNKACFLATDGIIHPTYCTYSDQVTQLSVLNAEEKDILNRSEIDVLNTLMILPVDYRGRKYFDENLLN